MTDAPAKQRSVEEAEKAVAEATEAVIQSGGTVHEEALWDVAEMALDGASKESMVDRLKRNAAPRYVPKGGWMER